jgi:hypothetical protein
MATKRAKEIVKQRGALVEHPFGTIKRTLGWDHYLVRGKEKVSGENALIMFGYNFKRLLKLIGTPLFNQLIFALKIKDNQLIDQVKQEIWEHILRFIRYLIKNSTMMQNIRTYSIS